MKTQKSLILKKAVNSEPDILCTTSDPRKGRSVIAVCEVTFLLKKSSSYIVETHVGCHFHLHVSLSVCRVGSIYIS